MKLSFTKKELKILSILVLPCRELLFTWQILNTNLLLVKRIFQINIDTVVLFILFEKKRFKAFIKVLIFYWEFSLKSNLLKWLGNTCDR